jgi:hypothetical protein
MRKFSDVHLRDLTPMFFLAGTDTDVFFALKFRVGKTAEPDAGAGNRLMNARQSLDFTLKGEQKRCQVRQRDIDELLINKFVGSSPLSSRKLYRE